MKALLETTDWGRAAATNNTYLLDGDNLIAYIPAGKDKPYYFKQPIKGFDRRGRKFEEVSLDLFPRRDALSQIFVNLGANLRRVKGSKGEEYTVNDDEGTCTCAGFKYRGACKHVKELA